ncbi:MAG: DUF4838 domain-containing protein [Chitinophagaceae bacterium]|nr:MAG: DUF4838 domain-containing protein [Chitinophagaceae bacterium]
MKNGCSISISSLNNKQLERIRTKYWVFLFLVLSVLSSHAMAQREMTIYLDPGLPAAGKTMVEEWSHYMEQAYPFRFISNSTDRFSGKGIYVTLTTTDRYKKAPLSLQRKGPEACYIKSSPDAVYFTANSLDGLQDALYLFLEKAGFRFYFPDPLWHIVPRASSFPVFEQLAEPSFATRQLQMGWGYGNKKLENQFMFWQRANRMGGWLKIRNEHAYYNLLLDKKNAFISHPEYLTIPLKNGNRQPGTVLNYSEPGLATLAYEWLVEQFKRYDQKSQPVPMLSLEPFDGNNYCNLPGCIRIGKSVSDQVFYFTNRVARKLKKSNPDKRIGVLAYNDHIDIPSFPVEDNIFVTLTNGYNTSNYSTDQLITRWGTKVKELGIYDYLGLYASTFELPGRGTAINYTRAANQIKEFQRKKIISYQGETTYGWITKGLSHYLIARLTWNSKDDVNQIIDEFFRNCFPNTRKWIEPIFAAWTNSHTLSENDLYQWYSSLQNAFQASSDTTEIKRLQQIGLYLHYIRLYKEYAAATGAAASKLKSDLCSYMWDIMDEGVIGSYAGVNTLAAGMPVENSVMQVNAAWKQKRMEYPKTKPEWLSYLKAYLPTLSHVSDVKEYKQAPLLSLQELKEIPTTDRWKFSYPSMIFHGRLSVLVDTRISDSNFVKILGGRLKKGGQIVLKVYPWNNTMHVTGSPLKTIEFSADSVFRRADLAGLPRNKYILTVEDGTSGGRIYFPGKLKYSVLASAADPILGGANSFYFYVPRGTTKFYVVKSHTLRTINPRNIARDSPVAEKFEEIKVGPDEWGWWLGQLQLETTYFIGIPPLVSQTPQSFLFPN